MKLIIVRHGESKHNLGSKEKHTFAGSSIDSELSLKGIETAEIVADKLRFDGVTMIFSSGLKRSRQTAEIIRRVLGIEKQLIEIPELNEINVGDFVGHTEDEVKLLFPEQAGYFYNSEIEKWAFPNGENFLDVNQRVISALNKIKKVSGDKNVLIVANGMINRIMFYNFDRKNIKNWKNRYYPHDKIVRLEIQ